MNPWTQKIWAWESKKFSQRVTKAPEQIEAYLETTFFPLDHCRQIEAQKAFSKWYAIFFQVGYLLGRPPDGWYFSLYKFQAFHKAKNSIFYRFILKNIPFFYQQTRKWSFRLFRVWKNILYKSVVIYNRVFFIFKSSSGALSKLSLVNHIIPRPHKTTSTCKFFFYVVKLQLVKYHKNHVEFKISMSLPKRAFLKIRSFDKCANKDVISGRIRKLWIIKSGDGLFRFTRAWF